MKRFVLVFAVMFIASACEQKVEVPLVEHKTEEKMMAQPEMRGAVGMSDEEKASTEYIVEGVQKLEAGDPDAAIASFDEAVRVNPTSAAPYLVLGQTYLRLGNISSAIDTFTAASRVAPGQGEIFYMLAITNGMAGNFDAARENARRSIELFQATEDEENFLRAVSLYQSFPGVGEEAQTEAGTAAP